MATQWITTITWIAFIGVFCYVFYLYIKKEFGDRVNIGGSGGILERIKGNLP